MPLAYPYGEASYAERVADKPLERKSVSLWDKRRLYAALPLRREPPNGKASRLRRETRQKALDSPQGTGSPTNISKIKYEFYICIFLSQYE
ncbi:hypothetical protein PQG02_15390 [Nostoc sp. UHCC 0926]|uniref:hypothetical protein n=1 Tax=unclassified Nostoc TaxID=2593658 RepID=UPI00235F74DF|nr:hypothetical protein [Nostoc sp. UHCC 0926]WDD35613.1 hypothetical protein PQG02_15390 [Nostoc sp. UHCC 0926]